MRKLNKKRNPVARQLKHFPKKLLRAKSYTIERNYKMIDRILYTFFGWLDTFSEHLDRVFFQNLKQRKEKKNAKIVNVIAIAKTTCT